MAENIIKNKSFAFALNIIKVSRNIAASKNEYVLSKQLLRCGTSIGANVREAINAQSKNDFISKMSIALKEAGECEYWLELLEESDYLRDIQLMHDCKEINRLLAAIVKSSKHS